MNGVDFDWTDAGDAEDHACKLEAVAKRLLAIWGYADANDLHIAAQCIRGLAEENANLKAENDRLWLALDKIEGIAEQALSAVKDKEGG